MGGEAAFSGKLSESQAGKKRRTEIGLLLDDAKHASEKIRHLRHRAASTPTLREKGTVAPAEKFASLKAGALTIDTKPRTRLMTSSVSASHASLRPLTEVEIKLRELDKMKAREQELLEAIEKTRAETEAMTKKQRLEADKVRHLKLALGQQRSRRGELEVHLEAVQSNIQEVNHSWKVADPKDELRDSLIDLLYYLRNLQRSGLAKVFMLELDDLPRQAFKVLMQRFQKINRLWDGLDLRCFDMQQTDIRRRNFELIVHHARLTSKVTRAQGEMEWWVARSAELSQQLEELYISRVKNPTAPPGGGNVDEGISIEYHGPGLIPHSFSASDSERMFLMQLLASTAGQGSATYEADPAASLSHEEVLSTVSQEWYLQWQRGQRVQNLLGRLKWLSRVPDITVAFQRFQTCIMEELDCERAAIWVLDHVRGGMWTRAKARARLDEQGEVLRMPLPGQDSDRNELGFVRCAFLDKSVIEVVDAQKDPRLNPDSEEANRTWSVLVAPIMGGMTVGPGGRVVRNDKEVHLVLQATNKKSAGRFDSADHFILFCIGMAFAEVMAACEKMSSAKMMADRKDSLLRSAERVMTSCRKPLDILNQLADAMHTLFPNTSEVVLHLVGPDQTHLMSSDGFSKRVELQPSKGFRGLVGRVAQSRIAISVSNPHKPTPSDTANAVDKASYDPRVDLVVHKRHLKRDYALHTYPVIAEGGAVAVCQFLCQVEGGARFGDDGSFNMFNKEHLELMNQLLNYFQPFLMRFYPKICGARSQARWKAVLAGTRLGLLKLVQQAES